VDFFVWFFVGDYDGLVATMKRILAVKKRERTSDSLFASLKSTVELLSKCDINFNEGELLRLDQLPDEFREMVKVTDAVKETIEPLIESEAKKLRFTREEFLQRMTLVTIEYSAFD
jgi:dynein heavy chain, axonemal